MSIWLFSGINGSGKTLNAIRVVLTDPKFAMSDDRGRETGRRPVFYYGVNECTLPWTELDEDAVKCWSELPPGSVVFIDECWRVFPSRSGNQTPPPYVSELAEHRKLGLDFVIITQRGMGQIDAFVRGLVERHIHLERIFGTSQVRALMWEKACDNVNDYHQRQEAASEVWKLDSKYFGAYKSAELHTIKARLPWGKIALVCSLPILFLVFAYFAWSAISGFTGSSSSDAAPSPGLLGGVSSLVSQGVVSDSSSWAASQIPRVSGMPWTAPVYDELTKPQSAPLPVGCLLEESTGRCQCGTWQGTPVDTSPDLCRQIATRGFFDPTLERPTREDSRNWSDRPGRGEGVTAFASVSPGRARFIPAGEGSGFGGGDASAPSAGSVVVRGDGGGSFGASGDGGGGGGGGGSRAEYGVMRSPFER